MRNVIYLWIEYWWTWLSLYVLLILHHLRDDQRVSSIAQYVVNTNILKTNEMIRPSVLSCLHILDNHNIESASGLMLTLPCLSSFSNELVFSFAFFLLHQYQTNTCFFTVQIISICQIYNAKSQIIHKKWMNH
jgi:hypothetical protein